MRHIVAILLSITVACGFGGAALAHEDFILPAPGLTPASPFYFLDRFGETAWEFFTFSAEGKARLQVRFAAERVAEIKLILEERGIEDSGLDTALAHLEANIAKATAIIKNEKVKGVAVENLAIELSDGFAENKEALKEIFREEIKKLKDQEADLRLRAIEALKSNDTNLGKELVELLADLRAKRELAELKQEQYEKTLSRERGQLDRETGVNIETEAAIDTGSMEIKTEVPMVVPAVQSGLKNFTIEGDDSGLYPSLITVQKGDTIKIIFKTKTTNVYFGGLDFRGGSYFNTGTVLPGGAKTVEFVADKSFEFQSYWPASGVLKSTGTVTVE